MRKIFFCLGLLLIFLTGCQSGEEDTAGNRETETSTSQTSVVIPNSNTENETSNSMSEAFSTPTIFIHGYSGTKGSFQGMLDRLGNVGAHFAGVIEVAADGTVSTQGNLDLTGNQDVLQLLFTDNKNNEWNQAQWLKNTLQYLGITKVNLVGHSMGGVDGLRYLLTMADPNIKVEKFVSIGAPFNEFEIQNTDETLDSILANGPQNQSARYTEFQGLLENFPQKTDWLNIVGCLDEENPNDGDGTVPLNSGLALTSRAQALQLNYQNEIITGNNAQHSQLHENLEVDQLVENFLW
ncbi:alpha/beta fold hydrolase [Enterococcus timonensis]|uniref:alpha/beta fold hydrolase n=1 Tax=Enterococcus timonensis TaxID=1852364 RepID=UPI0008DAA1DE|nr:alpha/beta fold hydrolase [Enterococcus timonensis]